MANRLAQATCRYLRQRADNPVDWWPWCDEALDPAHAGDKPALLSIGYSACHWRHLMDRASFERAADRHLWTVNGQSRILVRVHSGRSLGLTDFSTHQLQGSRSG